MAYAMTRSPKEMRALFNKLPQQEQWRLFIDGYRQEEGEGAFDVREPGYMQAMKNAFLTMLNTIDQPLTSELIIILHSKALSGVDGTDNENLDTFRDGSPGDFGLVANKDSLNPALGNASLEGIKEFINSGALSEQVIGRNNTAAPRYEILIDGIDVARTDSPEDIFEKIKNQGGRFYCKHESAESIEANVNKILDDYHQKINEATNSQGKLSAIIDMVSQLERRHIFSDGNARTLVMLVLNRELVKNGFSPVILDNPNRFDLFSQKELVNEVGFGMQKFWQHAFHREISHLLVQEDMKNKILAMKQDALKIKEKPSQEVNQEMQTNNTINASNF